MNISMLKYYALISFLSEIANVIEGAMTGKHSCTALIHLHIDELSLFTNQIIVSAIQWTFLFFFSSTEASQRTDSAFPGCVNASYKQSQPVT